ncbi:MAG: hypothetical protein LBK99_03760 [Opitutaceae bacterium]|nr:hypothetical protein [Opitutaceae bacterium]
MSTLSVVLATSMPAAVNLLTNGSFELGLGAEPFYPGWRVAKSALASSETPTLPVLDTTVAHTGKQSLKLSRARGKSIVYLDFQSPLFAENTATHFSFRAKTNRVGVTLLCGVCPEDGKGRVPNAPRLLHGSLATGWQLWECPMPAPAGIVPVRIEFSSTGDEPFDVWIDDVNWTAGKPPSPPSAGTRTRSGAVEVVLLPATRNGIHFADQPVALRWSADSDTTRDVAMILTLRDLTRNGEAEIAWRGAAALSPDPARGDIVLPNLKRGAWWAELEVRDAASQTLLGVGRERFTVMADLKKLPAPVDFGAGYHGGVEFGPEVSFNWRGHWTLDEFFATNFQTGFQVQRDIFDWETLEPERGKYVWDFPDTRVEAAWRNGCTTILCVPHKPLNLAPAESSKILGNPDPGAGRWLYQTARDITRHAVRSAPMGPSGNPNRLFAPDPGALADFMAALARRYHDKIDAIEFLNEANLYIDPEGLIEHYYKPGYPAIKRAAPDLPVLMNQTMDFAADGNGYTGQFLKRGGLDYSDGVFHHPYGVSLLRDNGLESVRTLERLAETYSKPDKKMLLGMSEIHGLGGGSRAFVRGEIVQRALLDWAVGCRWSAGALLTRTTFYEGSGPRHWFLRGPFAPGISAVHMNALYSVLGGYRFLHRIELDDSVLIMTFEKTNATPSPPSPSSSGEVRYAAVITAAQLPLVVSLLKTDFEGINLSAFDFTGEPVKLSSLTDVRIGMDALYLKSNDAALFDRLKSGRISWGQSIVGETEEVTGSEAEANIYATGTPPRREQTCGIITRWTLLDGTPGSGNTSGENFPLENNLAAANGELVWPASRTRMVDHPLPYVVLSGKNASGTAWHRAHTSIHAAQAGEMTLYFSATGPAVLWLNGTKRIDFSDLPHGLVGHAWRSFPVQVKAGMNHVLVQVASRGAPCAFALSANREALDNSPVAVDEEGFVRKWKMVGPWKNWRNREGKFQGNARAFMSEPIPDFSLHATGLRNMPLIWRHATFDTPVIPHPWVEGVSYAFTTVDVSEDTHCLAALGSDDGYVLWINGELAGRNAASRALKVDAEKIPVLLKKGRNQVLFKIDDTGGAGAFALRFLHEDGSPVTLTVGD